MECAAAYAAKILHLLVCKLLLLPLLLLLLLLVLIWLLLELLLVLVLCIVVRNVGRRHLFVLYVL